MITEILIEAAINKGAKIYSSVSGGKDGQAMVKYLSGLFPQQGLVHADLGRIEWTQSLVQCQKSSQWENVPLYIVKRSDGLDMIDYWKRRMHMLQGTGKPFWSSSKARYCTSDMKSGPINVFFTSTGNNFIISAEGIRANESDKRAQKEALSIRKSCTSTYYDGMSAEEAILNYREDKRLTITYYPVFAFDLVDVFATYSLSPFDLYFAREHYKETKLIADWWTFHPAYAMGNDRVSCKFCVLGSENDSAQDFLLVQTPVR